MCDIESFGFPCPVRSVEGPMNIHGVIRIKWSFNSYLDTLCKLNLKANVVYTYKLDQTKRSHDSARELYKDDRQSQWEMAKFDPQPTLNP